MPNCTEYRQRKATAGLIARFAVLLALFVLLGCTSKPVSNPEVMDCYGDTPYEKKQIALHLKRSAEKRAKIHYTASKLAL